MLKPIAEIRRLAFTISFTNNPTHPMRIVSLNYHKKRSRQRQNKSKIQTKALIPQSSVLTTSLTGVTSPIDSVGEPACCKLNTGTDVVPENVYLLNKLFIIGSGICVNLRKAIYAPREDNGYFIV